MLTACTMPDELSSEILEYYRLAAERDRLKVGVSQLEFMRTKEVIEGMLPRPPAVVLDVGGGPGVYSAWLAERGYEVHLIDPVPELVEQARELDERIATCTVGDARALNRKDQSADCLLLLGPLYHLVDANERKRALSEAYRVLRPGGLVFAAFISRFASALDGLARDYFADPAFVQIVERDLVAGVHENRTGKVEYFTTAQFHRPEELEEEIAAAQFLLLKVVGLEGPGWLFEDFEERWRDPRRREDLIRMARALEGERSIQGVSAHLLAVAQRPVSRRPDTPHEVS
jgi:ubiquinone/menaquinone biosynthesis C-methylase UbiE